MTPLVILLILFLYFGLLIGISFFVSRNNNNNDAFFSANRNAKWYLVAFGMLGTALSGVTFISVPGEVGSPNGEQFKYFQFVLGNAIGLVITATVLLPLYYRLQLISIYEYFEKRLGVFSYKTAAGIFLVSRTIGSAFRLYLVVIIFQRYVFDAFNVPFAVTGVLALALIYAYTYRAGLKAIIITDTLQTFFLVSSVILTIIFICQKLNLDAITAVETIKESNYSKIFFWEDFISNKYHFIKQILGGIFITIAMTGLDQDLMQKNLSCKNISEAQKNMFSFTSIFVIINLFFLGVGALLYIYADSNGIEVPRDVVSGKVRTDLLFPEIAFHHLSIFPAIVFLLGLIAATFATTDSALTSLTTSFCIDFLGMGKKSAINEPKNISIRKKVHLAFCMGMFLVIVIFNSISDSSIVSTIFKIASYTYGPLLGLFAFGMFFKNRQVKDRLVPWIAIASPLITLAISNYSKTLLFGYVFDNELIILNGLLSLIMLLLISYKKTTVEL